MTDLELTRLAAEAMGYEVTSLDPSSSGMVRFDIALHPGTILVRKPGVANERSYLPLHDDAQALALVRIFCLQINNFHGTALLKSERWWECEYNDGEQATIAKNANLNRAIVECVAKMQAAKATA